MTYEDKLRLIKRHKLCYRCLSAQHPIAKCSKNWYCAQCKSTKHHTLTHTHTSDIAKGNTNKPGSATSGESQPVHVNCGTTIVGMSSKLFAMTLPVWVSTEANPEKEILTYALIDSQSNCSYISNSLASEIQAETLDEAASVRIDTMTCRNKRVVCNVHTNLRVRGFHSKYVASLPNLLSRNYIAYNKANIPTPEEVAKVDFLSHIAHMIAPPVQSEAGLLLGFDCGEIIAAIETITQPGAQISAQRNVLGWCVVGRGDSIENSSNDMADIVGYSHNIVCQPILPDAQLKLSLNPFISAEHVSTVYQTSVKDVTPLELMKQINDSEFSHPSGSLSSISQDDIKFMRIMNEQSFQDANGFYTMPLPFKDNPSPSALSNNYAPVFNRFKLLLNKFKRDPAYAEEYSKFIQGIIDRGEAEEAPNAVLKGGEGWYLPHHGVYHKQKQKLRVVFDCSAQYHGLSLNDTLLQGPDLNNPLLGVLLRFRQNKVAVSCDIEKMYHRFKVTESDRDYLRFLWIKDGTITTYRMCVHIFGARSSPNCAKYGLNKLAQDHAKSIAAKQFMMHDFYVDDGLCSTETSADAIKLIESTKQTCKEGNLRLHKILSNNSDVVQHFDPSELAVNNDVNLGHTALGVLWSLDNDTLQFQYKASPAPCTRRSMLSAIASLYDPMGLLSPATLVGKILLQQSCKAGHSWDEVLDEPFRAKWDKWNNQMVEGVKQLQIPRHIKPPDFIANSKELHTFCDASESGYGACSYLRLIQEDSKHTQVHCTLIMGKSRVLPIKTSTMPRLELQAAVLAAKQHAMLLEELRLDCASFLWSDSRIVLGYLNNREKRLSRYVANRVSQILEITDQSQWHYVTTNNNPADIASRGVFGGPCELGSVWFKGPKFLYYDLQEQLQIGCISQFDIPSDQLECQAEIITQATANQGQLIPKEPSCSLINIAARFSSLTKACRVIALVQKVISNGHSILQKTCTNLHQQISLENTENALLSLIKALQKAYYGDEIVRLKSGQMVTKDSSLRTLDCWLDSNNIIRVGGRTKHSNLLPKEKHPIIIPRKTWLAQLIIRHYHEKCAHQGRTTTMGAIRAAGYWVIGLTSHVSSYIHSCVLCRRLRRQLETQKMADLPEERVLPTAPFTHSGCDAFGPFLVKERRSELKCYGLVFTCLVSRAVHIELLPDLSSSAFINSLRSFIALRGNVSSIRCDNGTNFVGAHHELNKCFSDMISKPDIPAQLSQYGCEFKFNPPQSSHFGGAWERMIRIIRNVLNGLSQQVHTRLSISSLRTLFYECMAIINSRPLTVVESDSLPLAPNDLLHMKGSVIMPVIGQFDDNDLYAKKQWKRVQYLADLFWRRWTKEYVHQLQQRCKWKSIERNAKVDDVVILHDECNRLNWKLGRVHEVISGVDGLVRQVQVRVYDSNSDSCHLLLRPIHKTVVLIEA